MAQRNKKRKITSWVTSSFGDFGASAPPLEKKHKSPRGVSNAIFGRKFQMDNSELWVDIYCPASKDDLAVHKKKVQEVESWLVESMAGMKGRRFLLLSGPSGCGKSAAVRVLAKEANLNLVEWINPLSSRYESPFEDLESSWIPGDTVTPVNQTDLFREFFLRTSKYKSICGSSKAGNLMLVEDFPNIFLRDPMIFHSLLRHYQKRGTSPVIFIVTDSTSQQSSVKHLFSPDIQQELSIINIQFNSIANGIMMKALNRIMDMKNVCEGSGGQPHPPREAMENLAEASGGDIRSAVNALQFAVKKDVYQLQELFASAMKVKGSGKSKSRSKSSSSKVTSMKMVGSESDGLAVIGGKDASLFLFRALGKILYCKRDQEKGVIDSLPKQLKLQERVPLQENAEDIFDKTSMGAQSLSTFLHQNMTPFFSDIDSVSQAMQHLTDADVLSAEWLGRDVLQNYAASVTIRGLMHANKTSSSSNRVWRSFSKPLLFNVQRLSKQNLFYLRNEHQATSFTTEELTTVYCPFQAKIFAAQGKGNFTKTREVGLFTQLQLKSTTDRLDELDANSNIAEDDVLYNISTPRDVVLETNKEEAETVTEVFDDPDEDFRIDDPDD